LKTLPIYTYGFEVLRKKTKKVTKVDDKLINLVRNMYQTMHKANGIGLAAPQIGLEIALTVIDISHVEEEGNVAPLTLLNPKLIDGYGEVTLEEGCLSIPHIRAGVTRPSEVYIEYQDLDLNKKFIEAGGLLARVAQHEIDHLNGVLFIDHINKEAKSRLKEELSHIRKGLVMADYSLADISGKNKRIDTKSILSGI
jgi:peptide deformylase